MMLILCYNSHPIQPIFSWFDEIIVKTNMLLQLPKLVINCPYSIMILGMALSK